MSKKKAAPAVPVLSLEEIAGLSTTQAVDGVADRYQSRARSFVEMGKLVWHVENRSGIPKGQTVYGLLAKRGVPESSVNNARLVEKFITAFVTPGLVTEARADEIITYRIVNQCARLISGKSAVKLSPETLAPLLNDGQKAAIGDELDSLDEHGLSIAGKAEKDAADKAEQKRVADAAAAAAAVVTPPATESTPAATTEPETVVVDGTKETPEVTATAPVAPATTTPAPLTVVPAAGSTTSPPSSHESRPNNAAEVLAKIDELELQSYDLDPDGLAAVRAKLAEWVDLLDSSIDNAKKSSEAVAA
jgi:hypothetical protein